MESNTLLNEAVANASWSEEEAKTIMGTSNEMVSGFSASNSIMGDALNNPEGDEAVANLAEARAAMGGMQGMTEEDMQKFYAAHRKTKPLVRNYEKIGNNEPCPCGSGKKYKNCCRDTHKYDGYTERGTKKNPYDTEAA